MASPFRIFRKYMKTLMVIFGVMIMFVFVILDPMAAYLGGGRAGAGGESSLDADDVAVTWNGGSLTNADVDQLVRQRQFLNSFILGVRNTGFQLALEAGAEPREPSVEPLLGPNSREENVEQSVVQTRLFADAAREAGMRVNDDAIIAYLEELGGGRVTGDHLSAMLRQGGDRSIPPKYLFDAIREEMLARNFLASHFYAFQTATPEQNYNDWLRVNDRIVIEAAPVPAESFLVDVPDPKPSELDEFFNEYRDDEPQPDFEFFPGGGQMEFPSSTPGFRVPRKIDVQFIEANYDEFLAKIESTVTEEEIVKYYEENKNPYFIKADTTLLDEPLTPEKTGDAPTTDAPAPTTNEDAPASDAATPAADGPAGENAEPAQPASETDTPATTGGDAPTATESGDAAPADGDQSFNHLPVGLFGLTALLQQPGDETPAADVATQDAAASSSTSGDTAESAASTESGATSTSGDQAAPAAATGQPAAEAEAASETAAEAKPIEYQTLDEVRDEIRRRLASDRAAEQLDALISKLHSELSSHWTTFFRSQLSAEAADRPAPAPPAALADLAPLAEKHGLKAGKTGPMSEFELRATPVGKSIDPERRSQLFYLLFRSKDIDAYQPISTQDSAANRFIAMKTSDTPGREPKLDEVKSDVVRAWKLQKAAQEAEKFATDEAKKAQAAGSPLSAFFAGGGVVGEVVTTDPFAMYTGGDIAYSTTPQLEPYRLSEPAGIAAAGRDFMEKVFQLKVGEVAAVMNHDRSIAYVVRLVEHSKPPEELQTDYLAEAGIWPGQQIMAGDRIQRSYQILTDDIRKSYGLDWKRTADQLLEDEED